MEAAITDSGGNSAPATSSGPSTFAEAFASDASPAPAPVEQSTTPPAAEQPGTEQAASTQTPDERSPFIPRARFDEVVKARQTAEQALADWNQYEWAKQVDRNAIQQASLLAQKYQTDRVGFISELLQQAQSDPELGPQLRSMAARTLAQGRGQQTPEMPQPDVAIYDQAGNITGHTYSDKGLAQRDQWLISQVLSQVEQKYAPRFKTVEDIQREREERAAGEQAERMATEFFSEVQTLPGFTKDIGKLIEQDLKKIHFPDGTPPEAVNAAVYRLYVKHVVPTLSQKAQTQVLDDLKTKAAASTSVNPASAAPTSTAGIKGFNDPRLQWS